jgi:hypothetical protein
MSESAKETFSAGRLLVRRKAGYLRAMVLGFAPIEVQGLGTIGVTEHGVMLIDWEFIDKVNAEEMAGLLAHECLHLLLKHSARAKRSGRDPEIDNKAADMAINSMVLDMGFKLPGGGPGVTPEQTQFYVDLLAKVRALPEWKEFMEKGAFNQTFMVGKEYADWVAKTEAQHVRLMKDAGFIAK